MGWLPSAFILETFVDGLGNFAVGNCVGIIQVTVCTNLFINVKLFDGVEGNALPLKL
jgi:hypothetical protein